MRAAVLVASLALVLAAAGCGGDDEEPAGGGTTAGSGTTATAPAGGGTTAAPSPGAGGGGTVEEAGLRTCVADAGAELRGRGEPYTDASGEQVDKEPLELPGGEWAGYVLWPSKNVADAYLAPSAERGAQLETGAKALVTSFGGDPARFVRRQGNLVLVLDDEAAPTDAELEPVLACAG